LHRLLGLCPCSLQAEEGGVGCLASGSIGACGLAKLCSTALDVEQVIDDLEGKADLDTITAKGLELRRRAFAENGPCLSGARLC
jgi:hypothetical protein